MPQIIKELSSVNFWPINNLLTNAVKYITLGGKVGLAVEETEDNIIFTINNSGIGIAEKDQNPIFKKSYRSEDDNVTWHSGHGLMRSKVGESSKFTLELKITTPFLQSN